MWKKAILPVETFNSRKLMLRFLAEAANFSKREVTANSNTVCFHTQEQTVCMVKASWGLNAAGACWIKVTNVKATVNLFSFFYQQAVINENKAIIPPSFLKKRKNLPKTKPKPREKLTFIFIYPHFIPPIYGLGHFLAAVSKWKTCLQNFPLPFQRTGQAQLHEHNKDEFPGLNTICNKVPLPEQEMQREGFSATWQIRARKPCQSKHHYWEGPARAQMTVGRVSCPGRPQSRYRYAKRAGSSSPRVELGNNCFLGASPAPAPLVEGLSFSKTCPGEIFPSSRARLEVESPNYCI